MSIGPWNIVYKDVFFDKLIICKKTKLNGTDYRRSNKKFLVTNSKNSLFGADASKTGKHYDDIYLNKINSFCISMLYIYEDRLEILRNGGYRLISMVGSDNMKTRILKPYGSLVS